MNVTMKSKYELEEYIPKYIKVNSEGQLESILSEIGGLYTVELKVSGVVEGTVNIKTKKFYSDEFATKLDITTAGSYIIDITSEDNYLSISSEDTFTDLVIDVVLKKKIIVNDSLYQGAWDASTGTSALPTPSEANKGYWYRVSVDGNGYVIGDITVSNGVVWEHFEIGNYELDDYVKKDGSTPFTAAQKGVAGVDADDLAVIQQVALRMLKDADSDLDMDGFDIDMGNGDISNIDDVNTKTLTINDNVFGSSSINRSSANSVGVRFRCGGITKGFIGYNDDGSFNLYNSSATSIFHITTDGYVVATEVHAENGFTGTDGGGTFVDGIRIS